ncbi:MAG: ABC transporter ATP-binding protein [Lachnospiraceae bacterium]|jgi:ABC-type sugar transport system ATPase subunit|nr:ABC transporter ATP-binding protein [Lachnospiraceae bacterium]
MPKIVLTDITKRWDTFYAVDHLDLTIEDQAFVTLLGPSGCGKTTTLRMIAGLETPTSGRITIGDTVVFDSEKGINIPANKRKVGFLFQNYALWPNMTVYQNISFGLTNVKEEMPTKRLDIQALEKEAGILENPEAFMNVVEDSRDKKGKLDDKRFQVRLIDTFTISGITAKELMGLGVHKAADPAAEAAKQAAVYREKAKKERDALKAQGLSLNDAYEVVKDGKVQTSVRKYTKEEIDLTVRRVSRIVKIGMFMDRYPSELSGGQQQRVAIARTLAPEPSVLFMDEPLSNLDAKLRLEMRSELQRLHLTTGSTFVYVTHDQMEAMTLATRICLIDNGLLQQYDAPLTVYNFPNNTFVADFVGSPSINFVEANGIQNANADMELNALEGRKLTFRFKEATDMKAWRAALAKRREAKAALEAERKLDKKNVEKGNKDALFKYPIARVEDVLDEEAEITENDYVLGVRPEFVEIVKEGGLEAEIYSAMPTGMETTVRVRIGNFLLTGVTFGGVTYEIGQKVQIRFKGEGIMLFDRGSGELIGTGSAKI